MSLKKISLLLILMSAQTAYGMVDCKAVADPPLNRFLDRHRTIAEHDRGSDEYPYFPSFPTPLEREQYYKAGSEAVHRERDIVALQAQVGKYMRTAFQIKINNAGPPAAGKYYMGLWGEVLQKSLFKNLNQTLGPSGMWLIFRAYPWDHLGFRHFAGPHMSVVIGERVYEIGRPLKPVGGALKLTFLGPAGPIAMDIDTFLLKTSLESQALHAQPGIFFAERIAGAGEPALRALADYYEGQAALFQAGKKFKYAMDPIQDPEGRNCVSYLTEPMLNSQLTHGIDLRPALGLPRYSVLPFNLLMETAGLAMPRLVSPYLFVDGDDWRDQLDQRLKMSTRGSKIEDPAFPGDWYGAVDAHPQITGFLFRRVRFSKYPH